MGMMVNGGHKTVTIRAGTAAAGTAPLKIASGIILTTPEVGAIEFSTDRLYHTQTTGTSRRVVAAFDAASAATRIINVCYHCNLWARSGCGRKRKYWLWWRR
ncbi:hypothetical protein H7200_02300 [Candidatus Saccharibacteria bacterium]|nr:hypothetical protein [Candidatus Saccharibacteria bacterium]